MKLTSLLVTLCFSLTAFAQDYHFGKVSKEELQEKFNPLDSSASATYLYKNRKSFYEYVEPSGFRLVTEVHERIKIYNQEGFDYATKTNRLSTSGGSDEELRNLKAYTYHLVNGKVEETKLSKDGIFKTELSKYTNEYKFTMPNVKASCVVEYKYRINSPFIYNVDQFVFQHDVPVKKIEARFEAPEYFTFKESTRGYLSITPKKSSQTDKIKLTSRTSIGRSYSEDLAFKKNITEFDLNNVPALKDEPYVNNINNYKSSVKYELSYIKYPDAPIKSYTTSWSDVVNTIYDNSNFGPELNRKGYFEDDIDALIATVSNPLQRTALIFNYVKNKVKWNGYYGYGTDDGVKHAYKDQVGNVAEINLMLTAMLQHAGLRAYPVLVSTRQHGVPLFPTLEGYNYVVSYVKLNEGNILLDATSRFSTPNVLPFRTLNWQGRVIAEAGGSTLIDLYPQQISENSVFFMASLSENGDLSGGYRSIKKSHKALSFRERYVDVDHDDFIARLENNYGGLEILDYDVKNELDLGKPIVESYKFVKESQADIIGDKMYFSPLFFLKTTDNPFKLSKREFPVDFGYPSKMNSKIVVKIPEGYKIESLPESGGLELPDHLGKFIYQVNGNGNTIQVSVLNEINSAIINPAYYEALKAYFAQMIEKENEQIVLSRI
ncbi:transglutaminase domain-containing protein [Algibacter sp. TI.3.09]|uniref:transglutaminase domain-containing protein n=1 Tax=Algibacter sp. TI.3.09 TaxID=3121298 RepID=UPI0031204FA5